MGKWDKALRGYNLTREYLGCESHGTKTDDTPFVTVGQYRYQAVPGNDDLVTEVEAGIDFGPKEARAYYIVDIGHDVSSVHYGQPIPYVKDERAFIRLVTNELAGAAEAAFNADILSCKHCGNHYNGGAEICQCEGAQWDEGDEDEDEDEDEDDLPRVTAEQTCMTGNHRGCVSCQNPEGDVHELWCEKGLAQQ